MKSEDADALVPVFSSSNHDAEMEAETIKSMLDANDIPAVVRGPSTLPSLEFEVQVPESKLEEARAAIEEARRNGPAAALEAEEESERRSG